jgi:hypothetical protein
MKHFSFALFFLALLGLCMTHQHPSAARSPDDKKADSKGAPASGPVVLTDEARRIHREAILVDGHNDLPWQFREKKDMSFNRIDITKPQPSLHTDIPRLRQGGVGAQFWSAFVPSESMKDGTAVKQTLEQIDVIHRMVRAYPDTFEMASTVDDIIRIHKEGKIASMIGIEGGHSIDNSLGRAAYALCARGALHDPHSLRKRSLGRFGHGQAGAPRPDAFRRASRTRDEPTGHAGRYLARVG